MRYNERNSTAVTLSREMTVRCLYHLTVIILVSIRIVLPAVKVNHDAWVYFTVEASLHVPGTAQMACADRVIVCAVPGTLCPEPE